ncbi:MAG: hypothetical protein LAT67_03975 [Balneolales bacterium]|nr:hypothetical protein [Balneolales bacterium]
MTRFTVSYKLVADHEDEAMALSEKVAGEQSVEVPDDVLSPRIFEIFRGHTQKVSQTSESSWESKISYDSRLLGDDLSQFLNVLLGNVSLYNGVKVTGLSWDKLEHLQLNGPANGINGVRALCSAKSRENRRPLLCSALKPIGLSTAEIAEICYQFALGGIDLIKDDHGLANQASSPFEERVAACTAAVQKAADETGHKAIYLPNVTADGEQTLRRFSIAKKAGAGGALVIPHLCGLHQMNKLAADAEGFPIMAHPAFSGSYVLSNSFGFTPEFLYGELWKAFGADFSIYPNYGGRFSFSMESCKKINSACREELSATKKNCFPAPGGGIQRNSIRQFSEWYGKDTTFLIGGSLYQHPGGVKTACTELIDELESMYKET